MQTLIFSSGISELSFLILAQQMVISSSLTSVRVLGHVYISGCSSYICANKKSLIICAITVDQFDQQKDYALAGLLSRNT